MPLFFGFDIGTSFIKAAILDLDAQELLLVELPRCRTSSRACLPLEADPSRVMSAVEEVSESLLRAAPRCDSVVLCGQMQGFVLVNGGGEPLSNYISWLDRRSRPRSSKRWLGTFQSRRAPIWPTNYGPTSLSTDIVVGEKPQCAASGFHAHFYSGLRCRPALPHAVGADTGRRVRRAL